MREYRQTTEYSGAAAALLMVINHYHPEYPLTKEQEFLLWRRSVNLPTRACSIYGLALACQEIGIAVSVMVGKRTYEYPDYKFKGYKKEEIASARFSDELHLAACANAGVAVIEHPITLKEVEGYLVDGKMLMLRLDTGGIRKMRPSANYVVMTGFSRGVFSVFDPVMGKVMVEEDIMLRALQDLVAKRKRDPRMLIFG